MSKPKQHWIPIMPGIYAEPDGSEIHVFIPELLARFGWPDDAEHRAECHKIVVEVMKEQFPDAPMHEVE